LKDIKKNIYTKNVFISLFIIIMFIEGALIGGALVYRMTSVEIDDLQNQIEEIHYGNDDTHYPNVTYVYNETSLSYLYKNVKYAIVEITGIVVYKSFFGTQYSQVQGSGFIYQYDNNYVAITNYHVVSDVTQIIITFSNGNSYPAELIASDAYSDLAILTVDAPSNEFHPLDIISSSSLEVGNPVIAIGSPLGLDSTMTTGIVSQLGRTIEESLAGSFPIANIIQTTVAINPGNSGGPLLDYQGNVVGITTAIIEDSQGLGFVIPSNTILREIESLVETGSYNQHPWIGVSGVDMTYTIAQEMNVDVTYGWLITSITSESAAENAGLRGGDYQMQIIDEWLILGGDIIIGIDGERIIDGDVLMSYLEEHTRPEQTIQFTVIRDNQVYEIPVTLGTRPPLT
jgi:S1-C subfamily serine protease